MSARDRESALLRTLGLAGNWLRGEERGAAIEHNAEVARFNRRLDLLQLGLNKRQIDAQLDQSRRQLLIARRRETSAIRSEALFEQQAQFETARSSYAEWVAGSRERRLDLVDVREAEVGQWAALSRRREAQLRGGIARAEETRVGVEREAQIAIQQGRWDATQARRGQIGVARQGVLARRDAGREVVAAEGARIGGARRMLADSAAARREARIEQVGQEVGAAIASGAARGMRGSFRQTGALRAAREGIRDIQLQEMETSLRGLELNVEEARLAAQGVGVERGAEEELARLGSEGAALSAEQVRIVREGRVARAGLDVRGLETGRAREVADMDVELGQRQVAAAYGRRAAVREERQQIRRAAAVERAGLSLQEAQARMRKYEAGTERVGQSAEVSRLRHEQQLGQIAQGINRWTRENVVELPDYETMGTRNALATVLSMTSAALD